MQRLEAIAGGKRSCRPTGTDEGSQPIVLMLMPERSAGITFRVYPTIT